MKILISIFLFFYPELISAQIHFYNPSFEGTALDTGDCAPPYWYKCELSPDIQPIPFCCPWYRSCYEGQTYEGAGCYNHDNVHESFGQKISMNLVPNKVHSFICHLYSVYNINNLVLGRIQIWGGFSICADNELLWQSNYIDSTWETDTVTFIPTQCYSYLRFVALSGDSIEDQSYIGVDALSEITIEGGYNFFNFPNTDTTINKGACVTLTATSDDTAATFYWSTSVEDSVATEDSIEVCPTGTTVYICTATLGCGQQFRDTVTVTVLGGGSGNPPLIIPNFLTSEFSVWQIQNLQSTTSVTVYNTLGQLVYKNSAYNNTLSITKLATATYFYEIKYGSNTYRGKLMVVR